MAAISVASPAAAERPQHRRNKSSKSGILKSFMSPSKSRPASPEPAAIVAEHRKTKQVPLLPADHPHARSKVLGERHGNVQSPPSSPSKRRENPMPRLQTDLISKEQASESREKSMRGPQSPKKSADPSRMKKSKSSTSLSAMFSRANRSSKDLSKSSQNTSIDKENTTPPSSAKSTAETPIWAQFSSTANPASRPTTSSSNSSKHIADEIAKYTPQDYSPGKQRNFAGGFHQPGVRPTLGSRPRSLYFPGADSLSEVLGRRLSGGRSGLGSRGSNSRSSQGKTRRVSCERPVPSGQATAEQRKVSSSSSTENTALKEKLTIAKRGARVMAAVAAFNGKSKDLPRLQEPALDSRAVDTAFEAVLDSRNVPEPMRQKMRSLTMRVKQDFIEKNQGAFKTPETSSIGTDNSSLGKSKSSVTVAAPNADQQPSPEEDGKAAKRSRPRSRTFTFTKGDRGDASPSKKARSQSKSRPTSIYIPKSQSSKVLGSTPTTPTSSSRCKSTAPTAPSDFIGYLRSNQDPVKVEVGRLHKLRLLLRNETVAWVDSFVSLGGMTEIVGLLHRTMAIEWREEHEDQLLHETLLCLKGLCTTERALAELEKVADSLFPEFLAMLFDEEKKGPAEYTTRTVISNVLFNFLEASTSSSAATLEARARQILSYLGEPSKPEDARPVDFVLDMRVSRPYKLWCREVSNVTKEVFWIFLHHSNVVPLPPAADSSPTEAAIDADAVERAKALAATYTQRHFPGSRPPVPAAPYIGGVEWDATTYLTAHLDLLNGLLASLPTSAARNTLRAELRASGFEKVMACQLRTCKEKFYAGVHDGLRAWVAAAAEDGWDVGYIRNGPSQEERADRARSCSPRKSPKKKEAPPQLEAPKTVLPKLDLDLGGTKAGAGDDDGWLG